MECRIEEVTVVLGEMDVTRVNSNQSNPGDPPVHKATRSHPTSQGRALISERGGERSTRYALKSVDNVFVLEGLQCILLS